MLTSPPPYNSPVDKNGGAISPPWMRWVSQLISFLMNVPDFSQSAVTVVLNAFSVSMSSKDQVLVLNPAGVLATGTITLPPAPYDGQPVLVSSTFDITSLTLLAGSGEVVKVPPTTLTAGLGFRYFFHAADNTWYRLS